MSRPETIRQVPPETLRVHAAPPEVFHHHVGEVECDEGEVDRIIELPIQKPTMPAFGGADLDTIFLTSISTGGSYEMSPGQPQAGGLFALTPGVRGLPEPLFAG